MEAHPSLARGYEAAAGGGSAAISQAANVKEQRVVVLLGHHRGAMFFWALFAIQTAKQHTRLAEVHIGFRSGVVSAPSTLIEKPCLPNCVCPKRS